MHNDSREAKALFSARKNIIYDSGTIKVVFWACFIIVLAVILTGSVSYFITRNAMVDKLKSRDLVYIIESITAKIDGRIDRAKEASLLLASDPMIIEWISGGETDKRLSEYSQAKINNIAKDYDYANSFVVSAVTNKYWAEGFKEIQLMSPKNPGDRWFYNMLRSGKAIDINLDYNIGRQDTFVFINTLVGDVQHPIAVAGVGLSLKSTAEEFCKYKFGDNSNLWLVDSSGKIYLSDDTSHNGKYLKDFLPAGVFSQVLDNMDKAADAPVIIEYTNDKGETIDLAYQQTKSTAWKVVFQIPRSESIAVLDNIKLYTAIAGFAALLLMVFIFYIVSNRIANPLKRALLLTEQMENQVRERTRELVEKNQKIMDSIEYAQRLQEASLPTQEELQTVFGDYFILWKPRDIVGGDFYWVRQLDENKCLIAVGDCTGHGVPGALMTMAVNSVLTHVVEQGYTEPAQIIAELNRRMKDTLHRSGHERITDDGLDIGVCYIEQNKQLTFAGAKIPLYIYRKNQVHVLKADKRSIGYRRSNAELAFTNHYWDIESGDKFYLTTDGYVDQNGGTRDYPFGRRLLLEAIGNYGSAELPQQREALIQILNEYMGKEAQRDDITLLGFSL